ncbi:MAG TPA: superoxide dismutase family protein [Mycobacterium sp.]|jgi:Cu-Zn family superoxide dismutase|nr:superoxide dismutase family protein [Mycobacterium sp.]
MAKPVTIAAALLAAPLAALSGCATNQNNPQPSASPTGTPTSVPAGTERLTAQLKSAEGTPVANATFDFAGGFATVTVETVTTGILSPGFHGMHIHSVGKCEANSVAPTGGASGNFNSAGGHYQAPGHTGYPASGDLTSLEVRSDGSAKLVATTDAITASDLLAGQKTALIIHEKSDNFANIPDRYQQKNGATGPDEETLSTGDAGGRVACGVIDTASTTTTTSTTTSSTTTSAATTTVAPATTTPATTATSSPTPAPTQTSTSTSTATITVPTFTPSPVIPPSNPLVPGNSPGG